MRNESLIPETLPTGMENFRPTTTAESSRHADGTLVDKYGRHVTYIRLSITDRCDFRCTYCMAEEMEFLPRDRVLSLEECLRVVRTFVGLGVTKVRITGGEPFLDRENFRKILLGVLAMPAWSIQIDTNGSWDPEYFADVPKEKLGLNIAFHPHISRRRAIITDQNRRQNRRATGLVFQRLHALF